MELTLVNVIADIEKVAKENNIEPSEMTISQYSKYGGHFDGRLLRKIGGFQAIINEAYRDQIHCDFNTKQYLDRRRNYVNKLERQLGDWNYLLREFEHSWTRVFNEVGPVYVSKLTKPSLPKAYNKERQNVAFVSDLHLGLRIDPEEVGSNKYNWQVAARRLGKYAEQVATYKIVHRDECPILRLCLGGDLGQGVIHPDYGTDEITRQCYGIYLYLASMIDYWRHHYQRIEVEFTPDNHMRMPHRGPDRNFTQKYDSFATIGILLPLQAAFRGMDDVVFHPTKSGISTFDVLGHKFGMTHGDTHIYAGNVGKSVDVKNIANEILKLNAAQVDHRPYDAMLLGHVHTPLFMYLNEADTFLIINGSGSGSDGYAVSQGFFQGRPHQIILESTVQYPVGDLRMVALDDADNEPRYEKIVPVYKYGLEIPKTTK